MQAVSLAVQGGRLIKTAIFILTLVASLVHIFFWVLSSGPSVDFAQLCQGLWAMASFFLVLAWAAFVGLPWLLHSTKAATRTRQGLPAPAAGSLLTLRLFASLCILLPAVYSFMLLLRL